MKAGRLDCPHCGALVHDGLTEQERRASELSAQGKDRDEIAAAMKVNRAHVNVLMNRVAKKGMPHAAPKRRGTPWTRDDIAKLRRIVGGGIHEAKRVATALRRPYTGTVWIMMRRHCSDLLPPPRKYKPRGGASYIDSENEKPLERQPWRPGDPKPEWLKRART